ncbi:MAG: type II toxin-antitoxin system VapC family toxin [Pseudonocardiaceae bacterium]
MPPHPEAPVLAVLDSEALVALSFPRERTRAGRRVQAVLVAVERLGGRACVPAPVIAEVARSASRRSGVDRVLRRLPVVDTDRTIATLAGNLLGRNRLDSRHAIDAFVASTALSASPAVVLTGDPNDFTRLIADDPGVLVQPLP